LLHFQVSKAVAKVQTISDMAKFFFTSNGE